MGEAKNRSRKQQTEQENQERGYRASIADQLASLYQKRASIIEARLNTEATIEKFRASIRPENAIGSSRIDSLASDLARTLECAQTCCDMAIDDLTDLWTSAPRSDLDSRRLPVSVKKERISESEYRRRVNASIAAAPPIAAAAKSSHTTEEPVPGASIFSSECQACASLLPLEKGGGCGTKPHPMPDGRCANKVDLLPTYEPPPCLECEHGRREDPTDPGGSVDFSNCEKGCSPQHDASGKLLCEFKPADGRKSNA
jgi:hypothetical protein